MGCLTEVPLINAKPELQVYFLVLLLAVGLAQSRGAEVMLGQVEGWYLQEGNHFAIANWSFLL